MQTHAISDHREITLARGDITKLAVDAIVNAANPRLLGGGGVDGAIHRAAGPSLRQACEQLPESSPGVRCPTGEARITPGFELVAKWVIHTVGPVYRGPESAALLASAYRSSLALANDRQLSSLAFPAISCGVFGYPLEAAATIALETCRDHGGTVALIQFALFGDDSCSAFTTVAARLFST